MNSTMKPALTLMPLASRRRLVVIGAVGLLIIFASIFIPGTTASVLKLLPVIGILLMVYGWGRFILPNSSGLPQPNQLGLDERQQQVVTSAYATAYRILACGVMLVGISILFTNLPEMMQMADKTMLFVALVWTIISLPTAVLAWNEPDVRE